MPTVSVCIVTYNSANDIEACLNAVLMQTCPVQQIIVIDNASADDIAERITPYRNQVHFIANKVNNGFAGGQNQAIRQTRSDYVLVLNPDVTLSPDYLSETIAFMERHPKVGSATGKLVLADHPGIMDSAGIGMKRNRQGYDLAAGEPAADWMESKEVFGVSGAAAVYRSAMIRHIEFEGQFFDEQFFAYKEDVDVAWRARKLGWTSYYVATALATHHRGWKKGRRGSMPLFVRRHSYQNRFFTLIKNETFGLHSFLTIPLILVSEAVKLGYIVLREPGLLACWPFIMKSLPSMLRKRKWIINKARLSNSHNR
ncbi:glycosyltransferase family 2 protein [Paenibacillus arenilitoris]|uniref:Glycosyltransferase family 2 protein n=1 Tax=Paenibacillus arenilitoris TaxID=2772299 RepID=A0A927CLT2_9BACL|nr:glycosyltransferase family 2 protein [Paenibacillus arenilitoris]MBD2867970.1 glycosyltransferase family 2 protein [Paenibacillus arenilitoris]